MRRSGSKPAAVHPLLSKYETDASFMMLIPPPLPVGCRWVCRYDDGAAGAPQQHDIRFMARVSRAEMTPLETPPDLDLSTAAAIMGIYKEEEEAI